MGHCFNIIGRDEVPPIDCRKCPAGKQQCLGCPRSGTYENTLMGAGFADNLNDVRDQVFLNQNLLQSLAQPG